MSTPTKRRKPNSYKSSPGAVGSLDSFFSKKKKDEAPLAQNDATGRGITSATTSSGTDVAAPDSNLTDEELARRLQTEWDEQDRGRDQISLNDSSATNDKSRSRHHGSEDGKAAGEAVDRLRTRMNGAEPPELPKSPTKHNKAGVGSKKDTLALQSSASAEDSISSTVCFDENPLTFDPSKYLSELKMHWNSQGGDASYGLLTRCFVLVNSTQSRIKIVDTLVNFLRTMIEGNPDSILSAVSFSGQF